MRVRSIKDEIATYWGACVTRFQPGYTVPSYTPDQFMAQLKGEVENWKKFGGTWAESDDAIADYIFDAFRSYAIWYGQIRLLPLPQNSLPEYEAWYQAVHA